MITEAGSSTMNRSGTIRRHVVSAAVAALALAASVAWAQPKPALVQDRDEPGRSPYLRMVSAQVGDAGCNTALCVVNFNSPAVPAGMRLVLTQISVNLSLADASTNPLEVILYDSALPTAPQVSFSVPGNGERRAMTAPVFYYSNANGYPTVAVIPRIGVDLLSGAGTVHVTLAGYFITL